MKKYISILGSTGSVGLTTLKVVEKSNSLKINLLSANKNLKLISNQIKKYKPNYFIINNYSIFKKIDKKFKNKKIRILNKFDNKVIKKKSDITVAAIPGLSGLIPTLKMIKLSKKILIANKEAIICGWHLIKKEISKHNSKIIPIDSEHFSISKLIENHNIDEIKKIYITASGGPFLNYNYKKLKRIKAKDALKHPKWKMGKKITIDSSTLMNKMLEIVEAQKLFNFPENKIEILIHPESLVHAIIKFKNGLSKFLYHETTMIIPIVNAIFDKEVDIEKYYIKEKEDRHDIKDLTFQKVNEKIFPIIRIKRRLNEYPSTSIIINASNEILVDLFLQKKIPFLGISKTIMRILGDRNYKKYAIRKPKNINQIVEIDIWARNKTLKILDQNV